MHEKNPWHIERETERVVAILSFQSKPQPHNTCYTIWARTTPLQQQSLVPHGIIYFLFHLRFISYNDHTPQKRALVFYIHTVQYTPPQHTLTPFYIQTTTLWSDINCYSGDPRVTQRHAFLRKNVRKIERALVTVFF